MVYFLICYVSWVLKRTVSTKRLFLCIQTHIFVRLGPNVRSEENTKLFDSILFATKRLLAQTPKARCEMSKTRAHFELKEWIPMGPYL